MTRSVGSEHARGSPPPSLLRGAGMVLAVVLGAIAVWLIVTSDTQKGTRVGALIGFWALLLAAFAVFGTRHPASAFGESGHPAFGGVTRLEDAAARREHELRVAEMLRREIEVAMGSQIATLRAEVSALREELVEAGGSQVRLERIETTRVVGSDIEAVQHDMRHLSVAREPDIFSAATTHSSFASVVDDRPPVEYGSPIAADAFTKEPIVAEPLPVYPPRPESPPAAAFRPRQLRAVNPRTGPPPTPGPIPPGGPEQWMPKTFESMPLPVLPTDPAGLPAPSSNGRKWSPAEPPASSDPFASMPRLRPADPEMFASLPLPVLPPEPPALPAPPPSSNGRKWSPAEPPASSDPFASMPRLRPADPEMFASLPLPMLPIDPPKPPSSNGRKWPPAEPPASSDPFASMPRLRPADPEMFASMPLPILPPDPPSPNGRKRPAPGQPMNGDPFASLPRLRPNEPNMFRSLPLPVLPSDPSTPPVPPAPNGRRRPVEPPAVNGDPFASMPRLRPFSDGPDPVEPPARRVPPADRSRPQDAPRNAPTGGASNGAAGAGKKTGAEPAERTDPNRGAGGTPASGSSPTGSSATGSSAGGTSATVSGAGGTSAGGSGRHATGATPRQIDPHHTGGRRRSSGENDDVLARILRREEER